ncbi:hypothetical protein BH23PLA1_BH23PLA1_30390 [soil metagenome]
MAETEETLTAIRAVYRSLQDHDQEGVRSLLDPDAVLSLAATEEVFEGDVAIAAYLWATVDAFPDLRHEIISLFGDGELGVIELVRIGTHTRPLRLLNHSFGPTGRSVRLSSCVVFRVREGKVTAMSVHTDRLAEIEQLGLPERPFEAR